MVYLLYFFISFLSGSFCLHYMRVRDDSYREEWRNTCAKLAALDLGALAILLAMHALVSSGIIK